jgi:RNA polymerase sigma factor for flagellar operon FliA
VPRLVRSRAHRLENATKALEAEMGRLPTEDELMRRLGVSQDEFDKLLRDATAVSLVSLSRRFHDDDSGREMNESDLLEDPRSADPVTEIQRNDLREIMANGLSRIERLILVLYYYEEMTMKEIGATLDLSESRVSQMHSAILARLRGQLNHRPASLVTADA